MGIGVGSHIHFLGICGTAMAGVAGLFHAQGYRVTGSDSNSYPPMSTLLKGLGIAVLPPRKENLSPAPDLVIVGNIVSPDSEEAVFLKHSSIPCMSMPQALKEFFLRDRTSLVVAGTHGKTTTTSMLSWVAENLDLKPGFLVGGIAKNFHASFQVPQGNYFIIEGDEYETCYLDKGSKFMHYTPHGVILHKVELEHVEYFGSLENMKNSFKQFISLLPREGTLISFAEDPISQELSSYSKAAVCTFGLEQGDYQAKNIQAKSGIYSFDIESCGKFEAHIRLPMFGKYNVLNALSVYALACAYGWDKKMVVDALCSFKGVKRRQELIGTPNGIHVVEDFAHHPTAVKMTVNSMKEHFPTKKLFAVLEPRSATSCRNIFQQAYVEALQRADVVLVVPPNSFRKVPKEERLSPEKLAESLRTKGIDAHFTHDTDSVVSYIQHRAQPGEVVLLMSNGSFGGIYSKMLSALEKRDFSAKSFRKIGKEAIKTDPSTQLFQVTGQREKKRKARVKDS